MAAAAPIAMAGASLVGSILGGKGQKKAAKEGQQLINADNAANRTFLEGIYNRNYGLIYPSVQQGQTAGNAIMELLGFGPQTAQPSAFAGYGAPSIPFRGGSAFAVPRGIGADGWSPEMADPSYGVPSAFPGAVTTTLPNARSAFDTYRGSTGYDFRFNEGQRALASAFGRNLDSGAHRKAEIRYGQGIASDEFARFMGYLTGQQQLGLSGASALAGVGQNFANNVVAGNRDAATAAANARIYAGNANANMWNNLGSSFGSALGGFGRIW